MYDVMRRELTFEAKGKVLTCCKLFSTCALDCCRCLSCTALQHHLAVAAALHIAHAGCLSGDDACWARPLHQKHQKLQGACSSNSAIPSKTRHANLYNIPS